MKQIRWSRHIVPYEWKLWSWGSDDSWTNRRLALLYVIDVHKDELDEGYVYDHEGD